MSRTPIVLIHGLMGTLDDPAIGACLPDRPVLAPHLLGYGEFSTMPPERLSIVAQIAHIHRLVTERFGAGPVHLVGHSMGGAIAPLFAATHAHLVATIINVEGNFTLKDAFWSGQLARMTDVEAEQMLARQRADPAAWLARFGHRSRRTDVGLRPGVASSAAGLDAARDGYGAGRNHVEARLSRTCPQGLRHPLGPSRRRAALA